MDKLSTKDQFNSNEDKVMAFLQVLQCAHDEAQFYLESSDWNIETAVVLWLDSHSDSWGESSYSMRSSGFGFAPIRSNPSNHQGKQYNAREVRIEGLHPEWSAHVNPRNGHIYFVHNSTGYQQISVPPGFADAPNNDSSPRDVDYASQIGQADMDEYADENSENPSVILASSGDIVVEAEATLVNANPFLVNHSNHTSFSDITKDMDNFDQTD